MNKKLGKKKKDKGKKGKAFEELVSEVVSQFHPMAEIKVGEWVQGPDGRRELDVSVRGFVRGHPTFMLLECKDYTYAETSSPVGIEDVDAFDSKRRDLGVDVPIIASNSGFTKPALSKSGRVGIGSIGVLKKGDERAKFKVFQHLYLRHIKLELLEVVYWDQQGQLFTPPDYVFGSAKIDGESLDLWLAQQAFMFQTMHPWIGETMRADFKFKEPVKFTFREHAYGLSMAGVRFKFSTNWLFQSVQVDVSHGVVDLLHSKIVIPPGKQTITLKDINFDTAQSCGPPTQEQYRMHNMSKGEFRMQFCHFQGLPTLETPSPTRIPSLVDAEDLSAIFDPKQEFDAAPDLPAATQG